MLDDIKKTFWATADELRANMDAAGYKHLVLGFICVKYVCPQLTSKPFTLSPLHYLPSLREIRLKPKPWPPCATPCSRA